MVKYIPKKMTRMNISITNRNKLTAIKYDKNLLSLDQALTIILKDYQMVKGK